MWFGALAALVACGDNIRPFTGDAGLVIVKPAVPVTSEAGGSVMFSVALASKPDENVTVPIASTDAAEGTTDVTSLTFTPDNFAAPKRVTVVGQDDTEADGTRSYQIAIGPSVVASTPDRYHGLTALVDLTNTDDDTGGVVVTQAAGDVSEEGAQTTFSVVLTAAPTSAVTLTIASQDPTEGTVAPTTATFTVDNWSAPQTITITGVDDALSDGPQIFTVGVVAIASADPTYDGLTPPAPISVVCIDDDSAGFIVSDASGPTSETGGQATFTVRLTTEPTADVVVHYASNDVGEGITTSTELTFTSVNWNAPQPVTVTGQNDALVDGNQPYQVVFTPTTSGDASYAAIEPTDVPLVNLDDETAGILVVAAGASTIEDGTATTFTVQLQSEPAGSVTIGYASTDPSEGIATGTAVTFTALDWNAPQTVSVTGQDDSLADGNQAYRIDFVPAVSTDPDYAGVVAASVLLTNIDNETAGFLITQDLAQTTESGTQAHFFVALTSQPTADVTVNFATGDATEGTITTSSLTFTTASWDAPQSVTVTGRDDNVADGNQPYQIVFAATDSTDPTYAALVPTSVNLVNVDNDSAGFLVTAISGNTTEDGGQATFSVALISEPTADVTVQFATSDAGEGTTGATSLTFTALDYAAPKTVTVTGQDDAVADGDQPYRIVFSATTSTDAGYAALTPDSVAILNIDNDTAGITVTAVTGDTTEDGGQATFTVVLNSEPTADVTVSFASDDATEGTTSVTALTFTSLDWSAPRAVTVTGQDDAVADGDQTYQIDFTATTSADPSYAGITPLSLDVTNIDNDTAGITVSEIDRDTTEGGGTAIFSIVLNSQPTANVTVRFASDDLTEGVTTGISRVFTPANWNAPRRIVVTGVNDAVADGNQPYQVDFLATTSSDAGYAGILPDSVDVVNVDDDSAGITVSEISRDTTEDGGQATFSVVLTSEPTASVTVNFTSDDPTEGRTTVDSLVFTALNYDAPQLVTVTGQDDAVADGNQPYQIDFSATTSTDAGYAAITPGSVDVVNLDNDAAAIFVSEISGDTTEAGGTAEFSIVLTSEPTASVTVHFASDDPTEGVTTVSSVTFTTENWSSPRAVTVVGQNDAAADRDQPYQIDFTATTSADAAYAAITPPSVDVINLDNESAGMAVSGISGPTSEEGMQATFTIALSSQPTANVTVAFASDDATEGVSSPASIMFTPVNWNAPRTVTVTGRDDAVADGDQPYQIDFSAATSADPNYAGIKPDSVDVVNLDDDTAGIQVTPLEGNTSEPSGTASFAIALESQPTANVTVHFTSDDVSEGTVSVTSLTFTPGNYQVLRPVTVTGVDDAIADGTQPYQIDFTATTSADPAYAAITPTSIDVTNADNDSASILVSAASNNTSEDLETATFTVQLTSQPTAPVTVSFASNDLTEGTTNVSSLTFSAVDWFTAQSVTITGVDDAAIDGNQPYAVAFGATTSADPVYAAITPGLVTLQNTDNDAAICGNSVLDAGEERDPPPGPFTTMLVNATTCTWEMASVPQLYCNGGCSWAGELGCDQADADLFCRLRTGSPTSTALTFQITEALAQPGFSCLGTNIGSLPLRGVNQGVRYQDASILGNHGPGDVISNPVCVDGIP